MLIIRSIKVCFTSLGLSCFLHVLVPFSVAITEGISHVLVAGLE